MKISLDITSVEVTKYFLEKCGEDKNAVEKEAITLLQFAVDIMNRANVSKDIDFVKKEVESIVTHISKSVDDFENNLNKSVDSVLNTALNIDVDASLMGRTKKWLSDKLSDVKTNAVDSAKLIIEAAQKVASEDLTNIKNGLKEIEQKLDPSIDVSYLGILKNVVTNVQGDIEELLDYNKKDSFSSKLVAQLETYFGKESPILQTFNVMIKDSQKEMQDEIIKLREEIAKREGIAGVMEKTAIKGFDFEDAVESMLDENAEKYGDIVTRTSKEETGTRSKKGDFIYEFNEGNRVVIETKDESIGLKPMLTYLKEAIENRDCEFGILCTKYIDQLPKAVGEFNLYEGNKLFCSYETLQFAIRWVRLYLTKVKSEAVEGIDKTAIQAEIEVIKNQIKNFSSIKSKMTTMKKAVNGTVDETVEILDAMKSAIDGALSNLENEIE